MWHLRVKLRGTDLLFQCFLLHLGHFWQHSWLICCKRPFYHVFDVLFINLFVKGSSQESFVVKLRAYRSLIYVIFLGKLGMLFVRQFHFGFTIFIKFYMDWAVRSCMDLNLRGSSDHIFRVSVHRTLRGIVERYLHRSVIRSFWDSVVRSLRCSLVQNIWASLEKLTYCIYGTIISKSFTLIVIRGLNLFLQFMKLC